MLCRPEGDTHLREKVGSKGGTWLPPRLMPDMEYPANCRVLVLSTSLDLSGSLVRREFAL